MSVITEFMRRGWPLRLQIIALGAVSACCHVAHSQTLVDNVFTTGFEGWTDTFSGTPNAGGPPRWGVAITGGVPSLRESSDGRPADGTTTGGVADGMYTPFVMVNTADVTPATYDLTVPLGVYDNDGIGVVFGYQDNDNYFRVGWRAQTPGSVGFQEGISVQKVVGGVITQLATDTSLIPTVDGSLTDVTVSVAGSNWSVNVGGTPSVNGTDADLQPGNYGVHSWGQRGTANNRIDGSSFGNVTVSSATLNRTTTWADAIPVDWRLLQMTNSDGTQGSGADDFGNFRHDFTSGTIEDDTNGFEWATATTPNVDFIGPGIVINEAGATSWTDYRMNVRMENADNDGAGMLLRVEDDDSFYRVHFSNEGMGTLGERAPQGLSIQKNDNGVWTELFRDDQANPTFVYTPGVPFDVSVAIVGDTMKVDVIDDPDGAATAYSYAPVTDASSPILSGSVGLTNWGSSRLEFSALGGDSPLLTVASALPEFDVQFNRNTGELTLINNSLEAVDIASYSITSAAGSLDASGWLSVADNYDADGAINMSVDSQDTWAETTTTVFELSEEESPEVDGSTLTPGQAIALGAVWMPSRIEDLSVIVELTDGGTVPASIISSGASYDPSDLDVDGVVGPDDWLLFFPNTLADLSSLTGYERAIAGDIDMDGDNDVDDFALFKTAYDAQNGAGALAALINGTAVPEPTTLLMAGLAVGITMLHRLRRRGLAALLVMLGCVAALSTSSDSEASSLDPTTFTFEAFPQVVSGGAPNWVPTPTTATNTGNASPSVFFGSASALNRRFIGNVTPGTDDDFVGIVLGFESGDADFFGNLDADYLLIDWKGVDQNFDFRDDIDSGLFFHDATLGGDAPAGLALSRVSGLPTGDELWQHVDSFDNPDGGVTELARGATLGETAYPRDNSSFLIDITYTPSNITVSVDGVEQFNESGSFPDGGFGFYTFNQNVTSFSQFVALDAAFTGLTATVDRTDGSVTLENAGSALEIDYYELSSPGGSLNATIGNGAGQWTSINSTEGDAPGAGWDEAGGSSSAALGELYLDGSAVIAGSSTIALGEAYNNLLNAEDVILKYRLADSGLVLEVPASYTGTPPVGLAGDYNGDGSVDAADYTVWRDNLGSTTANLPGDSTPGIVDDDDYAVWRANFGMSIGASLSAPSAGQVPEPASVVLLVGVSLAASAAHRWFGAETNHCVC